MRQALTLSLFVFVLSACGPNERIMNSANENRVDQERSADPGTNTVPTPRRFEQDLDAMRTADFNFIYVFRRKDGGIFDAADKSFITQTTPAEVNRRAVADEGKALIIGSNFRLPENNLKQFKERFSFEDFSKPESELPTTKPSP